jgi:hypothetical protein
MPAPRSDHSQEVVHFGSFGGRGPSRVAVSPGRNSAPGRCALLSMRPPRLMSPRPTNSTETGAVRQRTSVAAPILRGRQTAEQDEPAIGTGRFIQDSGVAFEGLPVAGIAGPVGTSAIVASSFTVKMVSGGISPRPG